jgi:phospholipid-binding lipoprotein MlaA
LPLLGPSNARDTGGLVVDYGLSLLPFFVDRWILLGGGVVNAVNSRALLLDEVRDAKEASIDYYSFVRNAYTQRRQSLIHDSTTPAMPAAADLYELEDVDER